MMGLGPEGGGLPFGKVLVAILICLVCWYSGCDPSETSGWPSVRSGWF
jgi:hypothetical protein